MNVTILWIGLLILGIIAVAIPLILRAIKKRKERLMTPIPILPNHNAEPTDVSHPQIMIKSEDHRLYEKFMKEYDSGSFEFNDLDYRKGAKNTCSFGVSEGYKVINNKMEWGYVRLHTGVDRAGGRLYEFKDGTTAKDPVISPFNFNRSAITDYDNKGYGSLVQLFNDEYGFEMRIAHMNPDTDFIPWSLNRIKAGLDFGKSWVIGSAGTYGASSGDHTHTEFLSQDGSCEVFDILLEEKYGDRALKEYTSSEIIRQYKKQYHFKNETNSTILKDWAGVKDYRGASFVNKYKYRFQNKWGGRFTRYASNLLFNGL